MPSQYIQDSDTPDQIFEPFLLLGLLANYNKFEYRNPYKIRLEDFVNESNIQKIVGGLGDTCTRVRSKYIAVQEDLPEGWNVSNTLSYIGLGVLAPVKAIVPISATDDSKEREEFAALSVLICNVPRAVLTASLDQTPWPPSFFQHTTSLRLTSCFAQLSFPPRPPPNHGLRPSQPTFL